MKSIIPLIIIIIGASSWHLFAQKELEPYLKLVAENNPALKASFSEYRAALEMIPQAKALPDPQIMFQYFTTPLLFEMGKQRFTLSVSQMFPWFGQLSQQEQAAAEMAKSKYEMFINKRNQLFYEFKTVYYQLYLLQKSIDIVSENIQLLYSMRELAKINFEAAKGSFVNVLRADMKIAELENQLEYLKDSRSPLIREFEKFINKKLDTIPSFPDTLWVDTLANTKNALLDSIVTNNPTLKQTEYEISAWQKQIEVAKKMGYPSFSLGLGYMNMAKREGQFSGNGKDMFMFPEIALSLPIYRNKYKALINEAKLKQESILFEKENLKNELSTELESTYRDYLNTKRSFILYQHLHALAKDARNLLLAAYSAAGTDFEEVLRMQEQELMYALKTEEFRTNLNINIAYINFLNGK